MNGFITAALLTVLLFLCSLNAIAPKGQGTQLTQEDETAIRATIEAYRKAWLANDAKGVLKTFTDDALLLPAHGNPAVEGIAAIERYWFAGLISRAQLVRSCFCGDLSTGSLASRG